ncbi:MAG: sulfatase maturation enzyme AslB (radical SAM superfamily) [Bradymonadia bacterium]|jgi:sulfatase maturation enzyme AslB (radical SAM superfamily)
MASMRLLVDDFVQRGYFGVILTGGEPTLHPELPGICRYAREQGLHVRMITNGHRLAEPKFAKAMAEAGLQSVHISIYSTRPEVETVLRGGNTGTLERAYRAIENVADCGVDVHMNSVIAKQNADHLDETVAYFIEHYPFIRHYVWNCLDPSMGRAEVNQTLYTPRLAEFEVSLQRSLDLLNDSGRTFRVEKVPLCYMTDYGWASTETRNIVKMEERIVHFLDDKQMVRITHHGHLYAEACNSCELRPICGGLFNRGDGYDPAELAPVFVPMKEIVNRILTDSEGDPTHVSMTYEEWQKAFAVHNAELEAHSHDEPPTVVDGPAVGKVTERGKRVYESKRATEGRKADRGGVVLEKGVPSD